MSQGGTYTLVIDVQDPFRTEVGALGTARFPAGGYAYTGSAFGAGGFSRVDRHRRLAAGDHDTRHWHVDYLLAHPASRILAVVRAPGHAVECPVAGRLATGPVPGFGASDCDCRSHLAAYESASATLTEVARAYRQVRGETTDGKGVARKG